MTGLFVPAASQALVREAWMDEVPEEEMTPEQKATWDEFQAKQKLLSYVCH